jgi:hypothetical protein
MTAPGGEPAQVWDYRQLYLTSIVTEWDEGRAARCIVAAYRSPELRADGKACAFIVDARVWESFRERIRTPKPIQELARGDAENRARTLADRGDFRTGQVYVRNIAWAPDEPIYRVREAIESELEPPPSPAEERA